MNEPNPLMRELASTYLDLERDGEIELPDLIPVTLAQWMLESGNGTSKLATRYFNYAGLKWRPEMSADPGRDDRGAARPVTCDAHDGRDEYCRFRDPESFILGYWRFIGRSPYRGYEEFAGDPEGYIRFLKDRHFAEDPRYVCKVLDLLPDAEDLLDELAGSGGRDRANGGRRRHRSERGSRSTGVPKDAVYLQGGPQGLVEEWEQGDFVADAETRGDVGELIDFLDTTAVAEYIVIPGEDPDPEPRRSRRTRGGSRRNRPRGQRRREDGVYIYDSAEGRIEEWENGELVADSETDGDLDRLLGFLDQTLVQNYFLKHTGRRTRRSARRLRPSRDEDDVHEPPLVCMDCDDEDDHRRGVLEGLKVALDVGHGITAKGIKDPGAVNKREGIEEHDLNRLVARSAAEILRDRGAIANVFLYDDPSERLTLGQRGRRAEGHDVFVSCHHNSASKSLAQRTETLLGKSHNTAEDRQLATAVQAALVDALDLRDGGVKTQSLGVMTGAGSLVEAKCLIEPYFITERSMTKPKAEQLSNDAGVALAKGIEDYWLKR